MSTYNHMVDSRDANGNGTWTTLGTAVVGAGGAVTQATDKSTGVTLSTQIGTITMNAASLAAATIVAFTLTNTLITAAQVVQAEHVAGGTAAAYTVTVFPAAGSAVVSVRNNTAGALAEAIQIRFELVANSTT